MTDKLNSVNDDDSYNRADAPQPEQKPPKFPPLNEDQIAYANELLVELHPLDKIPMREAFQWLSCITCYKKNDDNYDKAQDGAGDNHKSTMMVNGKEVKKKSKRKKKNNIGDKVVYERPIAQLGFGIVAYLDILWCLIWTFLIYSLFLLPTLGFFATGTAYDSVPEKLTSAYLDTYIGNLGYSSVQCAAIPQPVGQLVLSCPYGTIGEIYDYGVNQGAEHKYDCATNKANEDCKPNQPLVTTGLAAALGKQSHFFDYDEADLYRPAQPSCGGDDATLFVQYTCVQSEAEQHHKFNDLCLAVATGVLICLLFTVSIRSMYQGGKIQQIEWDCATVTAGDFSVEFPIEKESYMRWRKEVYEAANGPSEQGVAPAFALKQQMAKEIEQKLDSFFADNLWVAEALYGEADATNRRNTKVKGQYEPTKVADIVFSFDNPRLVLALRARGQCIASQDFDAMRAEEKKINELFNDFDDLTIPTSAFITFETDDSSKVAEHVQSSNQTLLYQEFKFQRCSEPTDIIWENRHYTTANYCWRQTVAFVIIGCLLFGSFIFIYWIQAKAAHMAIVFPPTDCGGIERAYGDKLQEYAVKDYDYTQNYHDMPSSGCLQCFCQKEAKANSDTYTDESYGQKDGEAICAGYEAEVLAVYFLTTVLSYCLIGINYVLRMACIMLVDWIGFATETERLSKTTTITFIVQFFNSAFLMTMASADLSEQPFDFGLTMGQFPDFNAMWFRSVGNILVGSMIFNVYYPVLEVVMYWAMRQAYRCKDRGWSLNGPTRSTSIQSYIAIYEGPLYYMHYKYSSILTIVYITFIYGFGMPVLFPIAMASFVVLYIVEKLMLFYGYVIPPMYDERLSQAVLDKLQVAPLFFLSFGYWMAANQQLVANDHLTPMASSIDTEITSHTIADVFHGVGWEGFCWPMLVTFIFLNFVLYFGKCVSNMFEECFPSLRIGDIDFNEDIDNYWATLDANDRGWSIHEERNMRENLDGKILTDEAFARLQSIKQTKGKTLQGVHSYDILANPLYNDDFQYVPAHEEDRANCIIDDDSDEGNDAAQSDLVRIGLNLAFMTDNKAKKFKFNKEALTALSSKFRMESGAINRV